MMTSRGLLLVISGPSGVGKGTVCGALISRNPGIHYSVSATTRPMRPGDEEGKQYFFKTREEFERMIQEDQLLEYANVHGNFYGTPRAAVCEARDRGEDIILEIDPQGALQIKEKFPDGVFIFISPPSLEELRHRLVHRGTESPEVVETRMTNAQGELEQADKYDYIVLNDNIPTAVARLEEII
ncbi:MAG TPA: guanylate kinase, partial [Bacillota bacterium]|nr:guanylate kinase [Bacillota bacterium]